MTKRRIVVATGLWLAVACLSGFCGDAFDLADALPEKTVFFIRLAPDDPDAPETVLDRIFAHPAVRSALGPLDTWLSSAGPMAKVGAGVDPAGLLRDREGPISFAFVGLDKRNGPRMALHLHAGESIRKLEEAMPRLREMLSSLLGVDGGEKAKKLLENNTVEVAGQTVSWRIHGGGFLLTLGSGLMEELTGATRADGGSLAESDLFRSALERTRISGAPAETLVFLRYRDLLFINPVAPPAARRMQRRMAPLLPEAMGYGVARRKDGYADRFFTSSTDIQQYVTSVIDTGPCSLDHAALLDAETEYMSSTRWRPERAWEGFWPVLEKLFATMPNAPVETEVMKETVAAWEKRTGFSTAALLDAFGPEITFATGSDGLVFLIDIDDAAGLQRQIDRLDGALGGMRIRTVDYTPPVKKGSDRKPPTYVIRYYNRSGSPVPYAPCFTLVDGRVALCAASPHLLKNALSRLDEPDFVSLSETPDYLRVMAETPPAPMRTYIRLDRSFARVWDTTTALMQAIPQAAAFNLLNPGALPPAEVFAGEFYGGSSSMIPRENGDYEVAWFSPLGSGGVFFPVLDIYASMLEPPQEMLAAVVGLGWFMEQREQEAALAREVEALEREGHDDRDVAEAMDGRPPPRKGPPLEMGPPEMPADGKEADR